MTSAPGPKDRWIPWAIAAFFICFIGILAFFSWIAFKSYTGEVTANAYKKGLAYNADIAHADAQADLGWKGSLDLELQDKVIDIAFRLSDASGDAVDNADITAYITRPTQAGHDQTVKLKGSKGFYRASVRLEWQGLWEVRVSVVKDGYNYQQSETVVLQ